MPETSVEFRLGQLDVGQKALLREVTTLSDAVLRRIEQHDRRDDERFASHGARLDALEKKIAVDEAEETGEAQRRAGWRFLLTIASGGGTGALVTWLLNHWGSK